MAASPKAIQILNAEAIQNKVRRLAYEIFEEHFDEKKLLILGISSQGHFLARLIHKELKRIHPIELVLGSVGLDKKDPVSKSPEVNLPKGYSIKNACVLLVDDVLNSGRTLAYAMIPLLKENPKKLQVCVLIDRDHKAFPVNPEYIGLSLATTLDEHVEVSLDTPGKESASLH